MEDAAAAIDARELEGLGVSPLNHPSSATGAKYSVATESEVEGGLPERSWPAMSFVKVSWRLSTSGSTAKPPTAHTVSVRSAEKRESGKALTDIDVRRWHFGA